VGSDVFARVAKFEPVGKMAGFDLGSVSAAVSVTAGLGGRLMSLLPGTEAPGSILAARFRGCRVISCGVKGREIGVVVEETPMLVGPNQNGIRSPLNAACR
jgi:hypothetical protein